MAWRWLALLLPCLALACQPLEEHLPPDASGELCPLEDLPPTPPDAQLVIAHRGLVSRFPENTAAALLAAADAGANAVEFDVVLSRDGIPVVLHDFRLERMTDCQGDARLLTWKQLARCRVKGQHPIPRLDELLPTLGAYDKYFIELKTDAGQARALAAAVGGIISDLGAFDQAVVISYNLAALTELRRLYPCPRLHVGFDGRTSAVPLATLTRDFDYMLMPWRDLDGCTVAAAARLGVHLVTYTVAGPKGLAQLQARPWAGRLAGIMYDDLDLLASDGLPLVSGAQRARQETETCLQQGLVRSPLDGHCQPPCGAHTCPAWQHCEEATGLCLETKGAAQGALELLDRVANLHGQGPVPGRTLPLEAFLELFWEGSLFAHRADLVGAQLGRLHPARLSRAGLELVALRELEGGLWQADTRAGTRWFLVQDRGQWLLDHFQN
jgi:glycerophosphoryl diester phosphodiesterase